jgi:hypothetical protein
MIQTSGSQASRLRELVNRHTPLIVVAIYGLVVTSALHVPHAPTVCYHGSSCLPERCQDLTLVIAAQSVE